MYSDIFKNILFIHERHRERERETNQETDSAIENYLMVTRREMGWGMDEIGDGD